MLGKRSKYDEFFNPDPTQQSKSRDIEDPTDIYDHTK